MKRLLLLFIVLILNNSYSQDSWIRIYQPSGWQIKSFYKIHNSDNFNSIFVQHNSNDTLPNPENGAFKKYSRSDNSWTDPANGFLNTRCATCIDPPSVYDRCYPVSFFMISNQDPDFMINYLITPCASCPDASTYMTYNRGINWISHYYIFGCGGSLFFPSGGDFDPYNDSVCYYGYPNSSTNYQPGIFKSTNRGQNWFPTDTIPDLRTVGSPYGGNTLSGGFIKVNPFNTNYIFTVHRDYMMLSTDAGYSFNSVNIPPLKELCFDYQGEIIYGVTQNKIYTSLNNGLNWDSAYVPFDLNTLEVSPGSSNIIYAGTTAGLYRSTNRGQSWYLYNNTFYPSKNVTGLSKDPDSGDTIIVCTPDAVYKVFRDDLSGLNQTNAALPSSFKLYQNYPNPFNPKTVINYELPEKQNGSSYYNVKLIVYNVLGNEVVVLMNNKQNAGKYSAEFDGSQYASGIYFYKIIADDLFGVRKMSLLK